jgi:hypothetical protein
MQTNNKNVPFNLNSSLSMDIYELSDLVLKNRFVESLQAGVTRYPIHRSLNFAARLKLQDLMDDLALDLGLAAQRIAEDAMMLDGEGVFITVRGGHKPRYCSCWFEIWAADIDHAEQARAAILARVGDARITEPMFSVDWHFVAPRGGLESAHIEELADDVLIDAAYPELQEGVAKFIDGYLRSPEAVLVLQGAPGTGKTRLIRAILGEISRRGDGARALYTGDMKALESDAIFVKFITGWDDVFVLEDADHVLKPRSDGNENLHRFLTIADGVVRAQGRKIIFSTNLPNVGDLDDALVRPGRCYARVNVRELAADEARRLLAALCGEEKAARVHLGLPVKKSYALAELYKAAYAAQ